MTGETAGESTVADLPGRPRPAVHFAPERHWMNDPNGLIQWNGRFHLFYQHNPSGPTPGTIAWGHASTTDLWTWEDHPLALIPDPDGPDRDGCYSGCAVVSDGQPYLLYTGVNGAQQLPCLAVADDQDLIRWTRYAGNPVIASPPPGEEVRAFRDHSAWRDGALWYQVVGGGLRDRGGALFLYRSADLLHWQYVGILAAAADYGLDGAIWECPDVFVLGDTAVVIVSVLDDGPQYAMWMTGQMTGGTFLPQAVGRCDSGTRYYAPQSLTLTDGRRVAIGWLRERLDELTDGDRSRVGVMSLPRELYLDGDGALQSRPARELDDARRENLVTQLIRGHATIGLKLSARATTATELDLAPVSGEITSMRLRIAGLGAEDVVVKVNADSVEIQEGGRTLTPVSPTPAGTGSPVRAMGGVRVYYDSGILEVYGPKAGPAAVICDRGGAYGLLEVELSSRAGASSCVASLTAWSSGRT
jgi:beta-fructofuranosidase